MVHRIHNVGLAEAMAYEEEFWREHFLAPNASPAERTDFIRSVGAIAWAQAATYFKEHPNEHNLPMIDDVPVASQADMRAFGRQLDMTTAAGRCWQALAKYESRCSVAGVAVDSQLVVRFFDAQHAARAGFVKATHLDLMSASRLARLFAQSRYDYYTPWAPLSRFPSMSLGAAGFLAFYINYELNLDPPIPLPTRRQKNTKPI